MSSTIQPAGGTQIDFNKLRKDQTYLFVDRSFQDSIIEYFQFLRREAILCDVTLRIGSQKFFCHRSILGVASPYFRSLFIDSESGRFIKNVDLPPEIDAVTMEALLGYMYGGKIFIDATNVLDIFKGASFFKLHSLLEECSFLLVKFLTPENCLEVREVSLNYGQEKLHQRCQRFLCDHFPAIANSAQFLELPQDELGKILISNALFVTSEKEVNMQWCVKYTFIDLWLSEIYLLFALSRQTQRSRSPRGDSCYLFPFRNCPMSPFSHALSLFALLLIILLTMFSSSYL